MKVTQCELEGLCVIELPIYHDNRGFFMERFHENKLSDYGLPRHFPQDNHSRSHPGVLRGLHCQHTPPQGKLVGTINGRIWDVAVDIRPDSATYGQHFGLELSDTNGKLLWIPAGFAHGFCVLGDKPADVLYKVSELYSPASETGILWNDSELNIQWPISNPIISDRDLQLGSFATYKLNPPAWNAYAEC
jgi:dTDP-4-dehydrorhamnose 3,5-epimerase